MFLIEIQNGKKYYFPILNKHTYLNISINNIYIYMVYIIFYIRHVKMDIHIYTLKPFTLMIYIYIYIYIYMCVCYILELIKTVAKIFLLKCCLIFP